MYLRTNLFTFKITNILISRCSEHLQSKSAIVNLLENNKSLDCYQDVLIS